jgi:branched-chain amino acid transport system permease protein
VGSIYALVALGYSMVYGICRLINFAHGDIIMVGAYSAWYFISQKGLPPIAGVGLSVLICVVLGVLIEKIAYRPLRKSARISLLITAIGISLLLENVAQMIFKATPRMFPKIINGGIRLGDRQVSYLTIVTILVSVSLMVLLTFFVNRTKMGKAMRAVSEDNEAAQLMGININNTISVTFAIGSGLAAVAGVLLCSAYPTLVPTTGSMPGIKAFTAAVFGGIGSIPGAFLGGLLLGIIESFAKAYISTQLANTIVFAVLIVVLLVRPAGLLGKYVPEKV